MKTIETNAVVTATGTLVIQLQTDIPPGTHPVVLVINPQDNQHNQRTQSFQFGRYAVGLVDNDFTFRREDLYARDKF